MDPKKRDLNIKLLGGASPLSSAEGPTDRMFPVGAENIKFARRTLEKYGLAIQAESTGGSRGRKLHFFIRDTGELRLAYVNKQEEEPKSKSQQTRVLIIDDSLTIQKGFLNQLLEKDPEITVVGVATNPLEAEPLIERLLPDVLTLDIHMP